MDNQTPKNKNRNVVPQGKPIERPDTRKLAHQKRTRGRMIKSNRGMIIRAHRSWQKYLSLFEKLGKDARRKRERKQRRAAHLSRMERDPRYRARCEKHRRDYLLCEHTVQPKASRVS
jgi:hypothetical protein